MFLVNEQCETSRRGWWTETFGDFCSKVFIYFWKAGLFFCYISEFETWQLNVWMVSLRGSLFGVWYLVVDSLAQFTILLQLSRDLDEYVSGTLCCHHPKHLGEQKGPRPLLQMSSLQAQLQMVPKHTCGLHSKVLYMLDWCSQYTMVWILVDTCAFWSSQREKKGPFPTISYRDLYP